jgi:hypothetical protein
MVSTAMGVVHWICPLALDASIKEATSIRLFWAVYQAKNLQIFDIFSLDSGRLVYAVSSLAHDPMCVSKSD